MNSPYISYYLFLIYDYVLLSLCIVINGYWSISVNIVTLIIEISPETQLYLCHSRSV